MKTKESILEYYSRISFVEWTPKEREVIFDAMTEYAQSQQTGTNTLVSGSLPTSKPKIPKTFCRCENPLVHDPQCPVGNDR